MKGTGTRRYLIKNSVSAIFRVGISSLSTLIITPFIIKNIGLSLFGYLSITSFFISYAGIFDLGTSRALVYLTNGDNISSKQKNEYISAFCLINIFIVAIVVLSGSICLFLRLPILGKSVPPDSPYYTIIMLVSILVLALSIFNTLQDGILEAHFKLDNVNYGTMLKIFTLNGLFLINLITYNNIRFYIISSLTAVVVTTIYYSIVISKTIQFRYTPVWGGYVKKIFSISVKFAGVGIFSSINSAMPRIAVTYLSNGLVNIAILDVITKLSMSIVRLGDSFARPFFALTRRNPEGIERQRKKILSVYSIGGIAFVVSVIIFRNQITDFFFHDPDIGGLLNYLLVIYVIAAVVYLLGQPMSMYMMGKGKINTVSKIFGYNTLLFVIIFSICDTFIENVLINLSVVNILMSVFYTVSQIYYSKR